MSKKALLSIVLGLIITVPLVTTDASSAAAAVEIDPYQEMKLIEKRLKGTTEMREHIDKAGSFLAQAGHELNMAYRFPAESLERLILAGECLFEAIVSINRVVLFSKVILPAAETVEALADSDKIGLAVDDLKKDRNYNTTRALLDAVTASIYPAKKALEAAEEILFIKRYVLQQKMLSEGLLVATAQCMNP